MALVNHDDRGAQPHFAKTAEDGNGIDVVATEYNMQVEFDFGNGLDSFHGEMGLVIVSSRSGGTRLLLFDK